MAITGANRVDVLDTDTNATTAGIAGTGARNLILSRNGRYLYSVTFNAVQVVDLTTNAVVANVLTGNIVTAVAESANGRFLYSCNNASATVSVIDTASQTVTATVSTGPSPGASPSSRTAMATA